MNFWENFYNLCKKNNIKPNQVAEKIGIASGTITSWKKGTSPNADKLEKIADFFDVSIDTLLGRNIKDSNLNDDERILIKNYRLLDNKTKKIIQKITQEETENKINEIKEIEQKDLNQ